jgi:hypothetical protein
MVNVLNNLVCKQDGIIVRILHGESVKSSSNAIDFVGTIQIVE